MCCTVTAFAPGTTAGTSVWTCPKLKLPAAHANATRAESNTKTLLFTITISLTSVSRCVERSQIAGDQDWLTDAKDLHRVRTVPSPARKPGCRSSPASTTFAVKSLESDKH